MQDRNWLAQQLDLLLTGYGYNLYNDANRARADDLLVRQRAGGLLGEAANQLGRLAKKRSRICCSIRAKKGMATRVTSTAHSYPVRTKRNCLSI